MRVLVGQDLSKQSEAMVLYATSQLFSLIQLEISEMLVRRVRMAEWNRKNSQTLLSTRFHGDPYWEACLKSAGRLPRALTSAPSRDLSRGLP